MGSSFLENLHHARFAFELGWGAWGFWFAPPEWFKASPSRLIEFSWLFGLTVWLIMAINSKSPSKREPLRERVAHIAFIFAGFWLLDYDAPPWLSSLNRNFVPDARWIVWTGAVVTLAGILFAIWARLIIGRNWSGDVQIKQGHELIRRGPYARIRHPIYTGLLLALAGTALSVGEYRGLVAVAIVAIGFARKARKEESFLAAQFGPAFDEHRHRTGFFLPRFS